MVFLRLISQATAPRLQLSRSHEALLGQPSDASSACSEFSMEKLYPGSEQQPLMFLLLLSLRERVK